jgi:hypothetical protein
MQRRVQNAERESRRIGYKDTDTTIASKDVSFRHMILNRTTNLRDAVRTIHRLIPSSSSFF